MILCSDSLSTQEAYLEVAQRISSFCETFKAAKLCSQTVENDTITIEDGTCAHNNHCLLESCLPEGMTDNDKRYFLVDFNCYFIDINYEQTVIQLSTSQLQV